jgi:FAD/FMN-containing dehydrogenase/Fe-S oxidoreductase
VTAAADSGAVAAALRAAGLGDVDASTRRRAEYSTDASLYRVVPAAVAFPRSAEEVAAALAACRGLGVPLTARGGGTSIAGNAVGAGVVLDFSRHMNRVRGIGPEARTAVVDPGVVLDDLQRAAAPHGLRFGPEPSTHSRCTIGGMIGNNSCGSRALRYGRTADNVAELDFLAGTGERLTVRRGAAPGSSPLLSSLHDIASARLALLRTEFGRFGRQISGYSLEHLLPENGFDAAAALTGTEGSCGLVLGATLRLVAAPAATTLVVLGYADIASAADAAPGLLPFPLVALEGLDARIVDVVRARRGDGAVPELPRGAAWLFAELAADSAAEAAAQARALTAKAGALAARTVTDPGETAALWRIREDGSGLSSRSPRGLPAHAGWEDAAVPPASLGSYLREFEELMAASGLSGMPYGHFGDGCVHIRIDFPLRAPGGAAAFREFIVAAARLVAGYGGSMSGEHGDGRARGELLPLMYSPDALQAFAAVKNACDPDGLLNPGIIQNAPPVQAALRLPDARPLRRGLGFAYLQDGGDLTEAVHRCIGVGRCVASGGVGTVMCPSYQATRDEKDSTRGRARVLQELANGALVSGWRSHELRESLDLCLACKGCASDCPAGVDMASYKAEVLHQAYRRRPRPAAHYSLGWLPRWAGLASRAPRLANHALRAPLLGELGRRLAGIDQRRELPEFAAVSFRRWFAGHVRPRDLAGPVGADPASRVPAARRVLLFPDTFTNYFTPDVGIAAVRVLEQAGCTVLLPDQGLCCGLTWISTGQLDAARRILRRTVHALAGSAADGAAIIGLEPSCTAVFRSDALELLGDGPEARAVAAATSTLAEFLTRLPDWEPPSLAGTSVVAQPHCHQHAVLGWQADQDLLARAGAAVRAVGGCCGLAGNFGVERGHYQLSAAIAGMQLLPALRAAGDESIVLADGFSCRTQVSQLAGRRALHLAELLADPGGRRRSS